MSETPCPVVHLDAVPLRETGHGDGFAAALGRIGPLIGARQLGCQLHIVPPGKAAFPRHAHHANEEMLVILSGEGEYRIGAARHAVRAGHVCAAPAGAAETAHQLRNTGAGELRYLCISTRHDPEVVEYPDSGKIGVMSMVPESTGMRGARVFHLWSAEDESLGYWDGEG
ncbi:cupin domain-containing protein [Paralimibaculum aggregatum]|uniref:Cupin domain-containing protein n=1 Tax=Paralimibaculum aggregatum TaxID=3036245 RepID=A0ABQ6LJZ7_9RHOB|nr:cupin domain-containing protein [Limibaculum sp. NKW23]GMG83581.1 cupin domain-containing protein [Limibaculum sp. NKW23]